MKKHEETRRIHPILGPDWSFTIDLVRQALGMEPIYARIVRQAARECDTINDAYSS